MGQISEEAFKHLLVENNKWHEYYDELREDNFSEKDKYDFHLKEASTKNIIEVNLKSSIFKKEYLTLEKGNLLAYPYQVKDINVQAFVEGNPSTNTLSNIVYLFGWATRSEVLGTEVNKLNLIKGGGRTYNLPVVRIHPIRELLDMIE